MLLSTDRVQCARWVSSIPLIIDKVDRRRCQGEFRICNGNTNFDFEFEDPESGLYALWHSACDNFNTYIVTTPSIVETPATISAEGCASNYDDCFRISDIHASCTRSFSSGTGRSSCLCQSTNLAIASRCEIDGASCLQSAIATSKLYSYNYCPNGAAPAGQMTVPASTSPGGPSVTNGGSGGVTTVSSPSGPTSVVSVPGVFSTLSTTTESHAHQLRLGLTSLGPVVFASNLLLGLFL